MSDAVTSTASTNTSLQPGEAIRAKWTMDGATTLEEAAQRLEAFAARLRAAHQQGWTLRGPVEDDYGFVVSPDGDAGWIDDEEPLG
jgi:hypothetical protein